MSADDKANLCAYAADIEDVMLRLHDPKSPLAKLEDREALQAVVEGLLRLAGVDEKADLVGGLAAAVNDANTLTPYLAIGLYPEPAPGQDFEGSGWELAGVFQADDARHGLEQAHDAEPEKVEWIIVPVEHVYRRAVEEC